MNALVSSDAQSFDREKSMQRRRRRVELGEPTDDRALWGIMLTNWIQQVGCDPDSRWNHSRNFVARWFNVLVFENGYHPVHHARPGMHWSARRAAHESNAHQISSELLVSSSLRYATDTYVLRRPRRGPPEEGIR